MPDNISEEMNEYLRQHPYLDVATTDMQRLILWIGKQPEKNVLLTWLNGAMVADARAALASEPRSDAVTAPDEPSTEAGHALFDEVTGRFAATFRQSYRAPANAPKEGPGRDLTDEVIATHRTKTAKAIVAIEREARAASAPVPSGPGLSEALSRLTRDADRVQIRREQAAKFDWDRLVASIEHARDALFHNIAAETSVPPLDVRRLASVMHDATCRWRPHSGFHSKTDEEYHLARATLLAARYAAETVDKNS